MDKLKRLPPEVNRVIFVRNLPSKITPEELYDIFGKFGPIRQIRRGIQKEKRGTAFIVYEDIYDAKKALETMGGFKVAGKYLILYYYQTNKLNKRIDLDKKMQEIEEIKKTVPSAN